MFDNEVYYTYSEYLRKKYHKKVYKLPVNLPVTCPNRVDGEGCCFCSPKGTGFESLDNRKSVAEQLAENKAYISRKYHADAFIAYFQNYTNTFLPLAQFLQYVREALTVEDIVELAISTRPDCIGSEYLEALAQIQSAHGIAITFELGLQTVNYRTLDRIGRGHSLAEFIAGALRIKEYGFGLCAHVILNLPWDDARDVMETADVLSALFVDTVKLHSLYIPRGSAMARDWEDKKFSICSKEEYIHRLSLFLRKLRPEIGVERLFSRIPEMDCVFSNWGASWWKLREEFLQYMVQNHFVQGCDYQDQAAKGLAKLGC